MIARLLAKAIEGWVEVGFAFLVVELEVLEIVSGLLPKQRSSLEFEDCLFSAIVVGFALLEEFEDCLFSAIVVAFCFSGGV
ncbi:hypothetical protein QYF36_014961 [Acer negundo]|nr:hypothetical protein QYF36_014961 [Acer negundo]